MIVFGHLIYLVCVGEGLWSVIIKKTFNSQLTHNVLNKTLNKINLILCCDSPVPITIQANHLL